MSESPASQLAKQRWKGKTEEERSEVARSLNKTRWEKWLADNPEKAAEALERRRKRAAKKKAAGRIKTKRK